MSQTPPSSLVKFASRSRGLAQHNQGELFFARASIDGAPYRSFSGPPAFTENEFENKTVRVLDPHARVFNLWEPEAHSEYLKVLDKIANGWGQCLFVDRRWVEQGMQVYIEWTQAYLEDGTITQPMMTPGSQG